MACVRSIFDEHQRLFGNGFHAWTTYESYCKSITSSHIEECFSTAQNEIAPSENQLISISTAFVSSTTTKASRKQAFASTTTQKMTQRFTQPTKRPATFSTTSQRPITALTTKQSSFIYSTASTKPTTSKTTTETSISNRLKIFDLYLSQYSTKKPQRYTIPQFTSTASPLKQPITLANPYTVRFSTSTTTRPIPEFHIANRVSKSLTSSLGLPSLTITTTTKQPGYYQHFFQSQIGRIINGTNLTNQNAAYQFHQQPIVPTVSTTSRPRILFRYSFSGTTTSKSQPIQ